MENTITQTIVEALIKEVSFSHPEIVWPENKLNISVGEWFSHAVKKGVSPDNAKTSVARKLSLPVLNSEEIKVDSTDGVWLNEGYYLSSCDTLFILDISDMPDPESGDLKGIGVMVGPFPSDLIDENCTPENHREILRLSANFELAHYSGRGARDASIKSGVLSFKVGSHKTPAKKLKIASILSSEVDSSNEDIIQDAWAEPVDLIIRHASARKNGRLLFLSGDYTKHGLTDYVTDRFKESSMLNTGIGLDFVGDVRLVDLESLIKSGDIKDLKKNLSGVDGYVVLISSSRSLLELFTKMKMAMLDEELAIYWGAHYIRTSVRQLCNKCRSQESVERVFSEDLIGKTITIRPYLSGLGCDYCVSGYRGFVFIKENMSNRNLMMKSILENCKGEDHPEYVNSLKPLPHKLISDFYKDGTEELNQLTSMTDHLVKGAVQVSDIEGLFV